MERVPLFYEPIYYSISIHRENIFLTKIFQIKFLKSF